LDTLVLAWQPAAKPPVTQGCLTDPAEKELMILPMELFVAQTRPPELEPEHLVPVTVPLEYEFSIEPD
jgi:hypothetical protein